jgi:hypothetical protein
MPDWLLQKLKGTAFQIDFGNFTVGLATAAIALITLFIAVSNRKALRNQKIAEFRKEWIENLRGHFAEFVTLQKRARLARAFRDRARKAEQQEKAEEFNSQYVELVEKLAYNRSYLSLMLNPKETQHQVMERKIQEMMDAALKPKKHDNLELETTQKKTDLPKFRTIARSILKAEWDRVKRET